MSMNDQNTKPSGEAGQTHTHIRTDRLERAIAALDDAMRELRGTAPKKPVLLLVKDEKGDRSISMPKALLDTEKLEGAAANDTALNGHSRPASNQTAASAVPANNAFSQAAAALANIQNRINALEARMDEPKAMSRDELDVLADKLSDRVYEKVRARLRSSFDMP